jgi:voltage-gated potassium channel
VTARARVHEALDPGDGRLTTAEGVLAVLILASVVFAVLETEPLAVARAPGAFLIADWMFLTIFGAEYLARLWSAPENPRFAGRFGRLRYALTVSALIDLLAIAPALLLTGSTPAYVLRLFRLARVLRLAKMGGFASAWTVMGQALASRRYELLLTLGAAAIALLVSASLLHLVEGPAQPDKFGSIPRALWWAVVTLTTIGYGDVFPVTPLGKVLAGVTAVIGIGLIAAPTAFWRQLSARPAAGPRTTPETEGWPQAWAQASITCGTKQARSLVTTPSSSRTPIPAGSWPTIQAPITGRRPSKSGGGA